MGEHDIPLVRTSAGFDGHVQWLQCRSGRSRWRVVHFAGRIAVGSGERQGPIRGRGVTILWG